MTQPAQPDLGEIANALDTLQHEIPRIRNVPAMNQMQDIQAMLAAMEGRLINKITQVHDSVAQVRDSVAQVRNSVTQVRNEAGDRITTLMQIVQTKARARVLNASVSKGASPIYPLLLPNGDPIPDGLFPGTYEEFKGLDGQRLDNLLLQYELNVPPGTLLDDKMRCLSEYCVLEVIFEFVELYGHQCLHITQAPTAFRPYRARRVSSLGIQPHNAEYSTSPYTTMSRINILLLISTWCSVVLTQNTTDTPSEKVGGHLGYIPNTGAAVIFFLLYLSVAAHATWLMFRIKGKYMTALVVCGYIYALGLILRIALGLYVFLNMCTVLSPCGFIATVYVLLGRLSQHLYAEEYLLIRPNWITKIYVTSDVFTLLVQATGGAMAGSNDVDKAKLAGKIFLVGLILQLVSFASYICVFGMFVYWMKTERVVQWNEVRTRSWGKHWKGLVWAVVISCVGITIRCIYRTIEGAQGFDGYLLTHEAYFYVLDVLPLLCAIVQVFFCSLFETRLTF
ncbi:unnamed protein product [Rhizoctonia solani]|uniref:Uncharacterized protein n=1 Tax=Rhizoctonia solani TaxID=456999 RepID=A0A8H3CXX9_9AGAM|nr:unnamed protein product [Rhizoctonia solani]